jgi:hypothetical protein
MEHNSKEDVSKIRSQVHKLFERAESDPALKKRLKEHPAETLVAEKIGFTDVTQVQTYMKSQCDGGQSCVDPPETNH